MNEQELKHESARGIPLAAEGGTRGAGSSRLLGRERELRRVDRLLDSTNHSTPVLFITGEPGIGKSRLLREAIEDAQVRGWATLCGRAYDVEGMPPYIPFVEIIRQHLKNSPDGALEAFATGAPELCRLLPDLCSRLGTVPDVSRLGPEVERFRLFEAVSGFLVDIAERSESRGLAVFIDDFQWADRATVFLLQHLSRRLAHVPLLLFVAFRNTSLEPGHPVLAVVADLTRDHVCEQLTVEPLTPTAIHELVTAITGSSPTARLLAILHRQTEGNPFFIQEVVRDLLARGANLDDAGALDVPVPGGVVAVIRRRLSMLSDPTNQLLQSAAVLGEAFTFDQLAATAGLHAPELMAAVEEAERAGMLGPDGESYAFTHALIRRAVYDNLSVPRRRGIHRRAAEAMVSSPSRIDGPGWGVLAHHWQMGGNPHRAIECFLQAGAAAVNVAAWEEASRHWRAAVDCMERTGKPPRRMASLLEGIGDLDFLSSLEVHACVASYDRAVALYKAAGDAVGAARARSRAGRSLAYPTSGLDYAAAVDYLREAETVLKATPDSIELGELYAALGHAESHQLRGDEEEITAWIRRLGKVAEKLDSDYLRINACSLEGHYLGLRGELRRGLELEERACAWALTEKDLALNEWQQQWHRYLLSYTENEPSPTAHDVGSYQLSRFLMRNYAVTCCGVQSLDLLDPARAKLKHELVPEGAIYLFYDEFFTGDLPALRQAVEHCVLPQPLATGRGLLCLADGDWEAAADGFRARAVFWRAAGSTYAQFLADRILIRALRALGDLVGIQAAAEEWLDAAVRSHTVKFELPARAELALALTQAHHPAEAEIHLRRCREVLSAGEDWRGVGGRARLAEAAYAAARDRCEDADAQFAAAVATFRELCLPWDEAEALETWGRACRKFHRGRIRQEFVTEKLRAAREIYARIGAGQPWQNRLDSEEALLAVILSGVSVAGLPDGLSAREAQVLHSIAEGHSNQQIADELFISLNTVARHVAHIFEKTSVANRAEAAVYATRRGLGD